MKIIFMGTPDFAVGILQKLVEQKCQIVGIITAPDKPSGRGQKISESAVKKYASANGLTILQPTNLKDENFIKELKSLSADLFVVVAFRMLPEIVWNMPPKGTINLHASLLPNYRGAAPINWAIMNGEKKTGVTTFFIEQEIDTGLIIEQQEIDIQENETAGELHDKLIKIGRELVFKSILKIENGTVIKTPQNTLIGTNNISIAPKIFKEMCQVDWSKSVEEVHNFCRGLSPYPTAWTIIENLETKEKKSIKLFKTQKTTLKTEDKNSLLATKTDLFIPCKDYYLKIIELQPEGKRRMTAKDFLAGNKISRWKIT